MMKFSVWSYVLFLVVGVTHCVQLSITPSSFLPGMTSQVTMRCDVGAESGKAMTQLLLMQLEQAAEAGRGNGGGRGGGGGGGYVPLVTLTPGSEAQVMGLAQSHNVQVEGQAHQFQNISDSYLSVTFPYPPQNVSTNYSCVVSGLSSTGLLVRFTAEATLHVSAAVSELPNFMTTQVVELRALMEKIRKEKDALLLEAIKLRQVDDNVTQELTDVEGQYSDMSTVMATLKTRASHMISILNRPVSDLDKLSSVRPETQVAFHASTTTHGRRVTLHQPIVFEHVITNQGQGYDPSHGVFQAPVTGTYVLGLSVQTGSQLTASEVSIMNGANILQTMHISDIGNQHEFTTTIAHLRQGEEVTCQFTWESGSSEYYGILDTHASYLTAFNGYILW